MPHRVRIGNTIWTVETADTFYKRLFGLIGRASLPKGCGLLLFDCPDIHTCFMRFVIDAVYLNAQYEVLSCQTLRPWCVGRPVKGARHVLELPGGAARGIRAGARLELLL